jgi:predicted nucleotidyltransferase
MEDKLIEKVISEIIIELKDKYNDFIGVYFFGSRLNGTASIDSDYDLMFIFDREIDWCFEKEVSEIIYPYEIKYEIVIDYKIYSYKEMLDPSTPFQLNVKREGIFYGV